MLLTHLKQSIFNLTFWPNYENESNYTKSLRHFGCYMVFVIYESSIETFYKMPYESNTLK